MGQSTLIWNLIAKHYAKAPIANMAAYEKKLALTREQLSSESSLFELGCGTGSTAISHAPFVDKIVAIDIAYKMLDIAKSKALENRITNIEFEQASIEDYSTDPASFDAALAMSILHIVTDRKKTLQKIHELLKPGGVFISSTVCMDKIGMGWKIFVRGAAFLRLIPLVSFLDKNKLVEDISNSGFQIDFEWQPNEKEAVFIIARKTDEPPGMDNA